MDITSYIGNTPMIKLVSENTNSADIFVKIEHFNAGGSIKSRVAKRMVESAEISGLLNKGTTIIEPTGGNTGIGLAIVSAIHNYKFIAVVPDNYSKERVALLKYYNAEVMLSDSSKGNDSHIKLANELLQTDSTLVCLNQFTNVACVEAHYHGTATEILKHITPDAFVTCVGSSGTFTGISTKLKEISSTIKCYVVQPIGCDITSGKAISHKIQGVSLGIKPPLLNYSLIDGIIDVEFHDIKDVLCKLAKTQGLFLGISSGANIVAALKVSESLGTGKQVCTVAPDGGQYYVNDIYESDN